MIDPWMTLAAGIRSLGAEVDARFEARARVYIEEVARWNRVSRLTGYRTEGEQVVHLVLDSLLFLKVLPEPASPLLDIGSGPGVPGLILKLARPAWAVTLVEANRRRANFMRHVLRRLEAEGAEVEEARAEALWGVPGLAGVFATVTLRAVAAPAAAAGLARPFLRPDGHVVIALGPHQQPAVGTIRHARLREKASRLRIDRAFLIIAAGDAGGEGQPDRST